MVDIPDEIMRKLNRVEGYLKKRTGRLGLFAKDDAPGWAKQTITELEEWYLENMDGLM